MLTHLSEMETPTLSHETLPISHPRTRAGRYLAFLLTSTAESRHSLKTPFQDGSLDSHDRLTGTDPERVLCYTQPCALGHGHPTELRSVPPGDENAVVSGEFLERHHVTAAKIRGWGCPLACAKSSRPAV